MQLTEKDLNEFIEIYQTEFGKPLSPEAALEMATRLIMLYKIIMRPIPADKTLVANPWILPDTSREAGE